MNVHLAQHLKGISITKTELLADVGQRHSFPYTGVEYLMSHHDGVMNLGVGRDPSIGYACKLRFRFGPKLSIPLNPIHHVRERINNRLLCRGDKQLVRCLLHPSSQRILIKVYLVTNSINAHYLSFAAVVSQTFPESRAQILRVVATVRFYEDVRIQHEQEASLLYQDDVPIFSDIFSKTSPFKPVRLYASR